VYLSSPTAFNGVLTVTLFSQDGLSIIGHTNLDIFVRSGEMNPFPVTLNVPASLIQRWDVIGYGDPHLYPILVRFDPDTSFDSLFEIKNSQITYGFSEKTIRIGFREVELIQDPLPGGSSFYFKVNNISIWAKGANWIPPDAFSSRVTPTQYRRYLQSMREANMNIIRVWGGGQYGPDVFYELADEMGLLVWQETMFACATYPTYESFLASVSIEIAHQILRLQHHPSIILWSTNNENEVMLADNWYDIPSEQMPYYTADYSTLYFSTVIQTINRYDTSRPILSSSPSDGNETADQPISDNPGSEWMGDVHYYDYTSDCWDENTFPRPRFASEYGYQSFPSFISLKVVSQPLDWEWDSPFMYHRQHHENGNDQIMDMLKLHFRVPNNRNLVQNFSDTLFLVQVCLLLFYYFF
jgi:beta-mannosidase